MKDYHALAARIAAHLGITAYEIRFESIPEDARLYFDCDYIIINKKYKRNYEEIAKSIAHEYRHIFQREYVKNHDDEIAKIWKEELEKIKNKEVHDYFSYHSEIDALAYTKYYLQTYENIVVNINNIELDTFINAYLFNQFFELETKRLNINK